MSLLLWVASFALRSFGNVSGGLERALSTLGFVALSTTGALVASRRPESPFGWIVSAYGFLVEFGKPWGAVESAAHATLPFVPATCRQTQRP
jgi:hypothetical protein